MVVVSIEWDLHENNRANISFCFVNAEDVALNCFSGSDILAKYNGNHTGKTQATDNSFVEGTDCVWFMLNAYCIGQPLSDLEKDKF